jgi:mono/diheme cytochrome c family protein
MCDVCGQLEKKIAHYRRVMTAMTDQLTIERIAALVAELEAQMTAQHPKPCAEKA